MIITIYILTCQECGHQEQSTTQNTKGTKKCKKCKSEAYDIGADTLFDTDTQKIVDPVDYEE